MSRNKVVHPLSLILFSFFFLAACDRAGSTPSQAKYKSVMIKGVPHMRQRSDFCGEACIAMALQKLGYAATQDHIFNLSGVDPALGRGCITGDMEKVLRRI